MKRIIMDSLKLQNLLLDQNTYLRIKQKENSIGLKKEDKKSADCILMFVFDLIDKKKKINKKQTLFYKENISVFPWLRI